jgi:hypothetical protein
MQQFRNSSNIALFLLGAFSLTQVHVIGYLGISELAIFVMAPYFLLKNMALLKKDGFMPYLALVFLAMLGCCIGSIANETEWPAFLRGMASLYGCFAIPVVLHKYLRNNLSGLSWILLGVAVSTVLIIFFFKKEIEVGLIEEGIENALELSMSSPLFWVSKIKPWITLPTMACYLKTPIAYSAFSPFAIAVIALFFSEGGTGRSAALTALLSIIFIVSGRKKRASMLKLSKHSVVFFISIFVLLFAFKIVYSHLAANGALGEAAEAKYRHQTRGGTGLISLIMGGRAEVGVCMLACRDKPILGHGPWAMDTHGYWGEYLSKYGIEEDYVRYMQTSTMTTGGNIIPTHSVLFGAWVWYGIWGAVLWLYVLWLLFSHLRRTIHVIPQWFGYFAIAIPGVVWDIFFSPFGGRFVILLLVTCVLLARAVARGSIVIPYEMQQEIV